MSKILVDDHNEFDNKLDNVLQNTLYNLVKIAEELDNEGKDDAAEEVHRVIRKYQEDL